MLKKLTKYKHVDKTVNKAKSYTNKLKEKTKYVSKKTGTTDNDLEPHENNDIFLNVTITTENIVIERESREKTDKVYVDMNEKKKSHESITLSFMDKTVDDEFSFVDREQTIDIN